MKQFPLRPARAMLPRIARLHSRAWIETILAIGGSRRLSESPGFIAGRGLKQAIIDRWRAILPESPGFIAGRGLKHLQGAAEVGHLLESPGFIAGRGLKHRIWRGCRH